MDESRVSDGRRRRRAVLLTLDRENALSIKFEENETNEINEKEVEAGAG